jgi:hypothetical protein
VLVESGPQALLLSRLNCVHEVNLKGVLPGKPYALKGPVGF